MDVARSGIGFDSHRFAAGRRLILGGVDVPFERGLAGHSDGDALCHAIADALLGAVADGDIGTHFPDTDPQWRDADSLCLLRTVARRVADRGADVVHVDATVVAQRPRLAAHVPRIRERLACALGIEIDAVSVKAKTAEQMGALGREEGIAVLAVATVRPRPGPPTDPTRAQAPRGGEVQNHAAP
jgi:2-C-methyl-D-erythritol 2,4-cyclodiphosphate synthase